MKKAKNHRTEWQLIVFYDGACPLCLREIEFLQKKIALGSVIFQDIASPNFLPASVPVAESKLHEVIHGILPSGEIVTGLEVFRRLYSIAGLGWILWPTGLPLIGRIADRLYLLFTRHRLTLGKLLGIAPNKSLNTRRPAKHCVPCRPKTPPVYVGTKRRNEQFE